MGARVATLAGGPGPSGDPIAEGSGSPEADPETESRLDDGVGRRRFTVAAVAAITVTAVPFLWILLGPWESPNLIRSTAYEANFYDLQTRAIFHGHLWLHNGAIGIEAFVHSGRQYTYFGLFPSIIRMPVMIATRSLDGKLTAPSMLAAWLLTGLFVSLLLWRVRILVRGSTVMGRVEAAAFGVVIATFTGGTVFMFLAATPYVFNEDLAWSVCLTVGSIFALLGVLERPSWGRVIASFALVLAANLDRATTGWACVVGAVLIATWFGLGRRGRQNRRWCLPLLGVGIVPLIIGCAVNYSKFGVLFGVSNYEQVWTHVSAYRRKFLAANHNAEEGIIFVPSNLLAYLRPDGLRLTSVFPFITLPAAPPSALSGVLFDRRYRTASVVASMPLLFLLSCWGLVTAFRPKPVGRVALTRILLLAAGSAAGAIFLWGYIAPRYLGDFVPFLVLASSVAMADIWRRLEGRRRSVRVGALGILTALALFTIAANIGVAVTPSEEWSQDQTYHYVQAQKTISDITGHPMQARVERGSTLPTWAPADQLFVVGRCDGLYISNGEDYSPDPNQQNLRTTWNVVERGHAFQHFFRITFNSGSDAIEPVPLMTAGQSTVSVSALPSGVRGRLQVRFWLRGPGQSADGIASIVPSGSTHQVLVITDPAKHMVLVALNERTVLAGTLDGRGPIHVATLEAHSDAAPSALSVVDDTALSPEPTLCYSLIR